MKCTGNAPYSSSPYSSPGEQVHRRRMTVEGGRSDRDLSVNRASFICSELALHLRRRSCSHLNDRVGHACRGGGKQAQPGRPDRGLLAGGETVEAQQRRQVGVHARCRTTGHPAVRSVDQPVGRRHRQRRRQRGGTRCGGVQVQSAQRVGELIGSQTIRIGHPGRQPQQLAQPIRNEHRGSGRHPGIRVNSTVVDPRRFDATAHVAAGVSVPRRGSGATGQPVAEAR
jgi:hypothetical protein